MKRLFMPAVLCLLFSACTREMRDPSLPEKNVIHVSFTAGCPAAEEEDSTKVILTEGSSELAWEGTETASIIIGKDATTTSKAAGLQIEVPSVSPGVFENDINLGSFSQDDVKGLVIPHSNGAYFRYRNNYNRIYLIFPDSQTQTSDGVLNLAYFPLYARIGYSDLTGGNAIQLKAAGNLLRFNVYGTHPQSQDGEKVQSVRIHVASGAVCGTQEVVSNTSSYYNGTSYGTVSLSEGVPLDGRTSADGVKIWMGVMGASRKIDTVSVTTDKAVYTKVVSYTIPSNSISSGVAHICPLGLNLAASGWTRKGTSPSVYYSVDGGSTWSGRIPSAEFQSLAVKAEPGPLTESDLTTILDAIGGKSSAVALDLSAAQYESATFPAAFKASTAVSSIAFPSNVSAIADSAFANCGSLRAVSLDGIATIGADAFSGSGLVNLTVPDCVSTIGARAFAYCYDLSDVYYNASFSNTSNLKTFGNRNQQGNPLNSASSPLTVTFGPNVATVPGYVFDTNQKVVKVVFEGSPVLGNDWCIRACNLARIVCKSTPPTGANGNLMDAGSTEANRVGLNVSEPDRLLVIPPSLFRVYNANEPWCTLIDGRGFRPVDAVPAFPSGDWPEAEPSAHSFNAAKLAEIASLTNGSSRIDSVTAVAVIAGGELIYKYENPARGGISDASYYIASCRKSMLSMIYGKYVENGTIDLNQTLGEIGLTEKVEEGYETSSGLTEQELTATVQHLIESRSGIYHKAANDPYVEDIPRDTYAPGEHYAYNNWDFNAAGYIFELKTGKNIFDAFGEQIAVPLGMQDWVRSRQYKTNNGYSNFSAYHMRISARDLARVAYLMLNKGRWGDTQVISTSWWHEMLTERTTWEEAGSRICSYGYMWWLFSPKWSSYTWHFKGAIMAKGTKGTWVISMPAINTVVVVKSSNSANSVDDRSLLIKLCNKVAESYIEG